jgi:UDP-GlcNAc:undecaprenyl-phosphate GlcNAc-1-phosphate transferase
MGDTGSLFLGFTLGALAVRLATVNFGFSPIRPVVLAVILALPIADTLWVMVNRLRHGKNPFQPDNTHLHHRLMKLGLKHGETVPVLYGLMFFFGILGWFGREWPEWWLFVSAVFFLASLYTGINWCERRGLGLGRFLAGKRNPVSGNQGARKRLLLAMLRGSRIVLPIFLFFFFLPAVKTPPSPPFFGFVALALALFVLLLYPWWGGRKEMPMAHGIFFVATFAIMLSFWTRQPLPLWLIIHANTVSALALLWVAPQLLWGRQARSLLPVSFEVMLIIMVCFVPLVLVPAVGGTEEQQRQLAWACLQAVPIIMLIKLTAKRHARRNRMLAVSFVVTLAGIGLLSFFH